jgi:hypothetical protein
MKALILAGDGAGRYIRRGYANAMAHVGIQCSLWHPQSGKPAFDVFAELQPDLVMCGSWEIDRAIFKNLMARPNIKVLLWGGNWGTFDKEIDTKKDTVMMVTDQEKEFIEPLVKNNNIKHIITYYSQRWADVTHNKWSTLGLEPLGLPLAADLVILGISEISPEYKCDLSFIGGYWPYKAINLNKFLVPLCHPAEKFNVKIFGYGGWPVAQHLGIVNDEWLPTLFSSSTVNANVFEPLAQKYGFDVNERCYKILACKGFCVSEYCDSAANDIFTNNEVVFAKTPAEFKEKVHYFVKHPEERVPYMENGVASIKAKHSYFHRLKVMMKAENFGTVKTQQKVESVLEHLLND